MAEVWASVCGPVASEIPLGLPLSRESPQLCIELGAPVDAPADFEVVAAGRERFRMSLPEQAVCEIDMGRARIRVRPAAGIDLEALGDIVVDHVLPRIKGERTFCLHAAAIACGGRAYALAGPSGAGKSTLALRLARSGAELLGDDCAAILAGRVLPTFRAARVRPESLPGLDSRRFEPDTSGKARLGPRQGVRIASAPVPLAGIVLVGARARPLTVAESVPLLAAQRFHLHARSPRALLDETLELLDQHGPVCEVDRARWSPASCEG
ncbi:MAG: hypothetical protein QOK21_3636 [Solirubrobacteraceae bacterium]|nr:hypothetical protein [Solirubrobacteraceae bacterium]